MPWPNDVLSAGEEAVLPRHNVAHLLLGADPPDNGNGAEHDGADDGGVQLPVRGLRVPATGRRPDVLRVTFKIARCQTKGSLRFRWGVPVGRGSWVGCGFRGV